MDSRGNGAKQTVVNSLVGKRGENSLVVLSENSENFTCEENWVKLVFLSTKRNVSRVFEYVAANLLRNLSLLIRNESRKIRNFSSSFL